TTPLVPTWRRWSELRLQLGILLHLACITLVGTVITVVLFGIAFSMLARTTKETGANSGARDRQMIGAEPETRQSAPTRSAVTAAAETPPAMTALAVLEPGSTQMPATGGQPPERSGTAAETTIASAELPHAPSREENSQYSQLRQPGTASTEIV